MKAALSLEDFAAKLEADKRRIQDYVVDTRKMNVLTTEEGGTTVSLVSGDALGTQIELAPAQHFHRQLGQDVKVRADLYDRLRKTHPALFDQLVNGLLHRWPEEYDKAGKRMIRAYKDGGGEDGTMPLARACLSDRYRRLDNYEVAQAVLPIIGKIPNVQVEGEVTETRMYIKVVAPMTQFDLQEFINPNIHQFLPDGDPDYVQAGLVIKNSEVGNGALSVEQLIYRLVCRNGLIVAKSVRKSHIGTNVTADDDLIAYREETVAADDKALLMKVQDAVTSAVDETRFQQIAAQFAETATGVKIDKPVDAMKALQPVVGLSDGERDNVLHHLLAGGDLSQFGAINAITRGAQDVKDYDRSVELEGLAASKVMAMPAKDWERIAIAA